MADLRGGGRRSTWLLESVDVWLVSCGRIISYHASLTGLVVEARQRLGIERFAHLWEGLEQNAMAAWSRAMTGSRTVGEKLVNKRHKLAWTAVVVEAMQPLEVERVAHLWEGLQ
jgi:hypothetical protein